MNDAEIVRRLEAIIQQKYPLTITAEDGEAFYRCIRRIMEEVPEDDKILVRGDYALVTAALSHPHVIDDG